MNQDAALSEIRGEYLTPPPEIEMLQKGLTRHAHPPRLHVPLTRPVPPSLQEIHSNWWPRQRH